MSLKPQLSLTQRQTLALTPMMRASLTCLRMPTVDLREEITRELEENPFLVTAERSGGGGAYEIALGMASAQLTLFVSLRQQIGTMRLSRDERDAALLLMAELREDGYLDATLAEIAVERDVALAFLAPGLAALQRCEPPGVGARDLPECLALKLIDAGVASDTARACVQELDAFAEENWPRLIRKLALKQPLLEQIARRLRGFSHLPVEPNATDAPTRIPEIIVDQGPNGTLIARLNPSALPVLRLAPGMATTVGASAQMEALSGRARSLVQALQARADTLLRIGQHLALQQSRFFLEGHHKVAPETRSDAAAALGLHPSTLGRAIAGKSLISQGQTIALETFFSRALPGPDGVISAYDVQRRIGELVQHEPTDAPLADDQICAHLNQEGIDIARRTVAKYRKCMRIPSSFERRRRKVS